MRIGVSAEPHSADSGPRRGEGRSQRPVRTEAAGAALGALRAPTAIPGTPRAEMKPACHRSEAGRSGSDACTHRLVAASHCCARALTTRTGSGSQVERRREAVLPRRHFRSREGGIWGETRRGLVVVGVAYCDWYGLWAGPVCWHDLGRGLGGAVAGSAGRGTHSVPGTFLLLLLLLKTYLS